MYLKFAFCLNVNTICALSPVDSSTVPLKPVCLEINLCVQRFYALNM